MPNTFQVRKFDSLASQSKNNGGADLPAIQMTTHEVPKVYQRLASAVGAEHWQGAVARQEDAIRANHFLADYLRSEYTIAYQLEWLRCILARHGVIPPRYCNNQYIFPAMAFAKQVLQVLDLSSVSQAKPFVKRVRAAFKSSTEMHGLRLELQAATHFTRRGYHVAWHRVKNEGTFDLLIDDLGPNGLEVECKSISENKGRRIHRRAALEFWGELWKDVAGVAHNLRSGVSVVLTVPNRLPDDSLDRTSLIKEVVALILTGRGATLGGGIEVRIGNFDPAQIESAKDTNPTNLRLAIDAATGTKNREAAIYGTPGGGMLAFVMQSIMKDDVLDQVFFTLSDSSERQFTRRRAGLFWVALQGIDADQLLSVHKQDSDPREQPTALKIRVSDFLHGAENHIVGAVFASRSGLSPTIDGEIELGGRMNFFIKEKSPFWHASFSDPLKENSPIL